MPYSKALRALIVPWIVEHHAIALALNVLVESNIIQIYLTILAPLSDACYLALILIILGVCLCRWRPSLGVITVFLLLTADSVSEFETDRKVQEWRGSHCKCCLFKFVAYSWTWEFAQVEPLHASRVEVLGSLYSKGTPYSTRKSQLEIWPPELPESPFQIWISRPRRSSLCMKY